MDPFTAWLLDWRDWFGTLGLMAASASTFVLLGLPVWLLLGWAERRGWL